VRDTWSAHPATGRSLAVVASTVGAASGSKLGNRIRVMRPSLVSVSAPAEVGGSPACAEIVELVDAAFSRKRSRARRWEYRVRQAIRSTAPLFFRAELEDPLLDVTQPILAEVDLVPDEERRRSEGPARDRTLRVGEELVLDLAGLD
jgi:hypothetical protein